MSEVTEVLGSHEFEWKGVSSKNFGLLVQQFPPVSRAKERVSTVTIPGRSGTLTLLQGDDVYEPVTKSVICAVSANTDLDGLTDWLRGSSLVRFGNEPDYQYEARIANQADIQHLFNNGWTNQVTIPFYCQPLKLAYPEPGEMTVTNGQTIQNLGTVNANPTITITVSQTAAVNSKGVCGDITFVIQSEHELQGAAVVLSGLKPGDVIVLDWFMGDAYFWDTLENANNHVTGNPQRFRLGDSIVSWTTSAPEEDAADSSAAGSGTSTDTSGAGTSSSASEQETEPADAVESVTIVPHWRWV